MGDYFSNIALQLGIPVWLLAIVLIWTLSWKLLALWKSARKGSPVWFIALALINTVGILEILYIFGFSKLKPAKAKPVRHKRKKKR